MTAEIEHGFWDTVKACQAHGLTVDPGQVPLLRFFFLSGAKFAPAGTDADTWRRSVAIVPPQHHEH